MTESQEDSETTGGRFSWLTKPDLLVKYHNNSAIVQELIAGKLVSGQWKEHPEFPGNQEMRLYRVWMEDYEVNENRHSRNLSHVRETEGSYEGIDASALGGAVPNSNNSSTPGNGRGDGNRDVRSRIPKEKKEKKEKTDDQLARAAIVKVNANLLEISQWEFKLKTAGVAPVVATAFVSQMQTEEQNLREAKSALENALAGGRPLKDVTDRLDAANTQYRGASVQIRKHATVPKARAAKAKAKGAAAPNGAA